MELYNESLAVNRLVPYDNLSLMLRTLSIAIIYGDRHGAPTAAATQEIIENGHARNVLAGWWTDIHTGKKKERHVGELLMLVVSELAEVPAHNTDDTMDDKLPHRTMFQCEIADALIRIFDIAGAYLDSRYNFSSDLEFIRKEHGKWLYESTERMMDSTDLDSIMFGVVRYLAQSMEGARKRGKLCRPVSNQPGLSAADQVWTTQFSYNLAFACVLLFVIGEAFDLELPSVIVEKMRFNDEREDHKIENRKQEGGKAF